MILRFFNKNLVIKPMTFQYKNNKINADITDLVDMPKKHTKPILRMEIDEVSRMLNLVETGEGIARLVGTCREIRDLAQFTAHTVFYPCDLLITIVNDHGVHLALPYGDQSQAVQGHGCFLRIQNMFHYNPWLGIAQPLTIC